MTIALAINTNAGTVLATDSASSMVGADGKVYQVYNNAIKIVNLYKGLPFGIAVYGAGSIGPYSIELLAKEFREKLPNLHYQHSRFNTNEYRLNIVAEQFKEHIFAFYDKQFKSLKNEELPSLGFILTGYSSGERLPETYVIEKNDADPAKITRMFESEGYGLVARGQPEAIDRLVDGFSFQHFLTLVTAFNLNEKQKASLFNLLFSASPNLVHPAMPLQDTIDLARFLAETAVTYQRFMFDDKTVGGPIEIATMSRYEGFKWVQRKHYYKAELNPQEVSKR